MDCSVVQRLQFGGHCRVQFMPAAMRHEAADQRDSRQCKVADHVEDLVSGAFIFKTKFIVDQTSVIEDQQVGRVT
ncbi:MAG: hypothetical protein R3C05_23895 [Pirellulaceae bacterium]